MHRFPTGGGGGGGIPPLHTLTKITRRSASQSTHFNRRQYPSSNIIDGNFNTLCATNNQRNSWVSVRVPPSSTVGYVAVYNRNDHGPFMEWLSPFEVWVGASPGDVSASATRCGGVMEVDTSQGGVPFVVECPTSAVGEYVTLRLVQGARYLTIAELEVYHRLGAQGVATKQSAAAGLSSVAATREMPDSPIWNENLALSASEGSELDEVLTTSRSLQTGVYVLLGMAALILIVLGFIAWNRRRAKVPAQTEPHGPVLKKQRSASKRYDEIYEETTFAPGEISAVEISSTHDSPSASEDKP